MEIKGLTGYNPDKDIPSLAGKVILITGANTGLGKATALALAKHAPLQIWMAARDASKGKAAVADVQASSPGVDVRFLQMDLASFASIKSAAATFLASAQGLHLLYLNAGILGAPKGVTSDGYEVHFGVNHVGHALLTKLLAPRLDANTRVVSVTSHGYAFCTKGILFDELKSDGGPDLTPLEGYIQSKLANVLYTQQLAKRCEYTVVSVTPGDVKTELFSREPGDERVRHLQTEVVPQKAGPIEDGVKNQLWAGTADAVETGRYYEPVGVADQETGFAKDQELAAKLWEWTQREIEGHEIE